MGKQVSTGRSGGGRRDPQTALPGEAALDTRFESHLRTSRLLTKGADIVVALSGGLDSVVLLDLLLGLRGPWRWRVAAAHFDHRMRPGSLQDADWVLGLCDRRGVVCRVGVAEPAPRSEAEARELRYRFLDQTRVALGAEWLATAHHADDQAETVLFRLRRGAGLRGVAGIPELRSPGVVRPLLPFRRKELEAHAFQRGLEHLADPSNADLGFERNWIRHRLIPALETTGNPHLRAELCRLASLAARAVAVVDRRVEEEARALIVEASERHVVVARTALLAYDKQVRAHLLRALLALVGPRPNRTGTRIVLEFASSGVSGRAVWLSGGSRVSREFDRLIIEGRSTAEPLRESDELVIPDPVSGRGVVTIGGAGWQVRWTLGPCEGGGGGREEFICFDPSRLSFPLTIRAWQPGDRIRLPGGTRKLKRVFVDKKVGRSQRGSYPVIADADSVLAIVGLLDGVRASPEAERPVFTVYMRRL